MKIGVNYMTVNDSEMFVKRKYKYKAWSIPEIAGMILAYRGIPWRKGR